MSVQSLQKRLRPGPPSRPLTPPSICPIPGGFGRCVDCVNFRRVAEGAYWCNQGHGGTWRDLLTGEVACDPPPELAIYCRWFRAAKQAGPSAP